MTDKQSVSDRLERLESIVDQQQELIVTQQATIDNQRDQLDELATVLPSDSPADRGSLPIGRRNVLQAGGVLALLGVGAGVTTAQPQGQVGTESQPLEILYTAGIEATTVETETIEGVTVVAETDDDEDGTTAVEGETTADSGETVGVLGTSGSSDGVGVRGENTSDSGYGVHSDGDSKIDGDQEITGDTEMGGELSFFDGSDQQTAGPIAKAWIDSSEENDFGDPLPEIENGVNVDDVTWFWGDENIVSTAYEITLSDIHYTNEDYVTIATPRHKIDEPPAIPSVLANQGGDLRIRFEDIDGEPISTDFQFVTYALPDGTKTSSDQS